MSPTYFQWYLEGLHKAFSDDHRGELASYIPELLRADPAALGIALVTVDGHVYQVGNTADPFTMQSITKVFTYGMALAARGSDTVMKTAGVEPSGEAFNSISLEPGSGRPMNPMINAGAIAITSLLPGNSPGERLRMLFESLAIYCGRDLGLDEQVYESEQATGHRNRAIAHMLVNYGIIDGDPEPDLDLYFRQCSVSATCRDLAVMAATLANQGVNPITSVRAIQARYVPKILSVMASCGMYDYSGAWIYDVGMPAKSGVGGGIIAVLPSQFGLAVYSPRLDERGNSVRGIAVCQAVSADFGLHIFQPVKITSGTVIRAQYSLAEINSKRTRSPRHAESLTARGTRAQVIELAGELSFNSAELVLMQVTARVGSADYLVVDFSRVSSVDSAAIYLLAGLARSLHESGVDLLFTGTRGIAPLEVQLRRQLPELKAMPLLQCAALDLALEWCEDKLLEAEGLFTQVTAPLPLAEQYYAQGLSTPELAYLESRLTPRQYRMGDYLCREGETDDTLHFIVAGEVSVVLRLGDRRSERLATLSAGAAFGELAMVSDSARSADVIADTEVTTLVLTPQLLEDDASEIAGRVLTKLVKNIAIGLSEKLRKANLHIRSLGR